MIYGGIDEAGYGPKLGPLVVSGALLRTPGETDLWTLLRDGVSGRDERDGRVVVQDSKVRHAGRHGLRRLEETVWPFLRLMGVKPPVTSKELIRVLGEGGEARGTEPWYREGTLTLPLEADAEELEALWARLRGGLKKARAEFLGFR